MSPRGGALPLNKLVEYMEKHHALRGGNAYESTRPETVMRETCWSRRRYSRWAWKLMM